ncbi:helix-turn-helix domain-containing protein [Desulfovibrio mangrovi]|uniref:helix-turn-helix domain-containing protein n=1 Tax=Desulfovibrio mangrovi TaxID=2976983 RepID=UPI0022467A4C|nr:helix-turn-helix domain-containing protein [Desulfovibrio mangrovi]UZP66543.1 helix-turn-helix domain-containing protein [Desulfovibrio mangrovi]
MKNATTHDNHALLTIAELATRFSLPESTARYYCKRFLDYLPHVGEGKRRRYRGNAVAVFAVILEEMKKNKNAMAVEAVLSNKFPKNIDVVVPKPQAQQQNNHLAISPAVSPVSEADAGRFLALMEQQTSAMQSIAGTLEAIAKRDSVIQHLEQALETRNEEVTQLRKEVEHVKTLQSESEKLHQQDLDQMRKWLGRIASEQANGK